MNQAASAANCDTLPAAGAQIMATHDGSLK
jgi:hypothetical protein